MTNKDKLFTRTYSWEDEEIVVVGNRGHIADTVPEVIECEVVFRNDGRAARERRSRNEKDV
jgi:hypothetical protein